MLYPNRIVNVHPPLIPSFCGKGFYGLHVPRSRSAARCQSYRRHGTLCQQRMRWRAHHSTKGRLRARGRHTGNPAKTGNGGAEWSLLPQAVSLICDEKVQVIDGITHIQK